jgi:predicted DCC family thiol-disulfide oxidoreductase YuxK
MVAAGAAFSMFRVRLSSPRITDAGDRVIVDVFGREPGHDLLAFLKLAPGSATLPDGSAFGSAVDAQAFLVDRFVAFVPGTVGRAMRRVRVRRGTWDVVSPSTVDVRSDLLDGSPAFPVGTARLDHTFVARGIPYHWHTAEVELGPGRWRRPLGGLLVRDRGTGRTDRQGTLLFDQDCGICTATAGWLGRRVEPARLGLLGIGSVEADRRIASLVECRDVASALHFVRVDGAVLTGARAVLAAGRLVPRWRVLAILLDHRPGHIVLEPLYRQVAAHRLRMGRLLGLPQTCAVPPRVCDPR